MSNQDAQTNAAGGQSALTDGLGGIVAWELLVRGPNTDWRRYNLYDTKGAAMAAMERTKGDPLQLKVCPLYSLSRIEALLRAADEAAEVLRQEATIMRECHTLDGEWDGTEPEVQAEYDRLMALAARLTHNGPLQGRGACAESPASGGSASFERETEE